MGITTRFQQWNHTHASLLMLVARTVLGLILLAKGIFFISHAQQLKELILQSNFAAGTGFWTAYVCFAHLFGGVFLILGLFTRIAAIMQLPVLIGAIFFIIPQQQTGSDLAVSVVALLLLVLVIIKGAGDLSMDDYRQKHEL
jgi:uncharacterized membrane protein YphA (DoxX/SURF4 family)